MHLHSELHGVMLLYAVSVHRAFNACRCMHVLHCMKSIAAY